MLGGVWGNTVGKNSKLEFSKGNMVPFQADGELDSGPPKINAVRQ